MGVVPNQGQSSKKPVPGGGNQKARKHIVAIPVPSIFGRRKKQKRPMSVESASPPVNSQELTTLPPDSAPSSKASSRRSTATKPVNLTTTNNNNNNNNNNNSIYSNIPSTPTAEINLTSSGERSPITSPTLSSTADALNNMLGGHPETPRSTDINKSIIVIDQPGHLDPAEYDAHDEELQDE